MKPMKRSKINLLNVVTIFDSRIRPGSLCVIAGNAIMGRHTGRGGKSGSRLISTTNRMVLFRVTGGIQYEFSTTEDSSMTLIGAIVEEDYNLETKQEVTENGSK